MKSRGIAGPSKYHEISFQRAEIAHQIKFVGRYRWKLPRGFFPNRINDGAALLFELKRVGRWPFRSWCKQIGEINELLDIFVTL